MKIYYVDIDGTICTITNGQYHKAQPLMDNINKVNRLHDEGNTIIYWTARGSISNLIMIILFVIKQQIQLLFLVRLMEINNVKM